MPITTSLNPSTKTERSRNLIMPLLCVYLMQILTFSRNLIKLLSFGSQTNCNREILVDVMQRFIQSYFLISNNTAPKENWDSLVQYIQGITSMATQWSMPIYSVLLQGHRAIWLIKIFHLQKILLLPVKAL